MFSFLRGGRIRREPRSRLIDGRFRLGHHLGGRTRSVYKAIDEHTGQEVAVKVENEKVTKHLNDEIEGMQKLQGSRHIPRFIWGGVDKEERVLVMQLLGPSLETVSLGDDIVFDHLTVCFIAVQVLEALREIHSAGFVHCSLSPKALFLEDHNVPRGDPKICGSKPRLYIRKFRLLKSYLEEVVVEDEAESNLSNASSSRKENLKEPDTDSKLPFSVDSDSEPVKKPREFRHVSFKEGGRVTGVPRYASVNSHAGLRLGRRDDIESLGYMLVYFSKGTLPWQGLTATTKEAKRALIFKKKTTISLEELCAGVPEEVRLLLEHAKMLTYSAEPCYEYLLDLFQTALDDHKYGDYSNGICF